MEDKPTTEADVALAENPKDCDADSPSGETPGALGEKTGAVSEKKIDYTDLGAYIGDWGDDSNCFSDQPNNTEGTSDIDGKSSLPQGDSEQHQELGWYEDEFGRYKTTLGYPEPQHESGERQLREQAAGFNERCDSQISLEARKAYFQLPAKWSAYHPQNTRLSGSPWADMTASPTPPPVQQVQAAEFQGRMLGFDLPAHSSTAGHGHGGSQVANTARTALPLQYASGLIRDGNVLRPYNAALCDPLSREYHLARARANPETERQQLLRSSQTPPSTPPGSRAANALQHLGSIPPLGTSPFPGVGRLGKPCCSSPSPARAKTGDLVVCLNCHAFTAEDTESCDADSSVPSTEGLVQCCSNPDPFDVGEDGSPDIVCLNCNESHNSGQIFAAMQTPSEPQKRYPRDEWMAANIRDNADPPCPAEVSLSWCDKDGSDMDHGELVIPVWQEWPPPFQRRPLGEDQVLVWKSHVVDESDDDDVDSFTGEGQGWSFHRFLDLPKELRERIYQIVLQSNKPIAPHLCDADRPTRKANGKANSKAIRFHDDDKVERSAIRFHDDNQAEHNAIYKTLTVTRVSRQVRAESLPIFYGTNTFDVIADTPTYFSRLEQLDRFHMIRQVTFVVQFSKGETSSQKLLWMLLQHFEEEKAFETEQIEEARINNECKDKGKSTAKNAAAPALLTHEPDATTFYTDNPKVLKSHPQHSMGGLEANFLVLRMLSATFQDGDYNRKLVIHVPTPTLFTQYNSLIYFPSVCEGLGIQLQLVSGRDVEMVGSGFRLSWAQKFQKKSFADSTTAKDDGELETLTKRVRALYPNIEEVSRPAKRTYYRRKCKSNDVEWFSIDTAGGFVAAPN
ncbi:hypothetical protein SLS60_007481 [Paraconiothyrium brasiliense]|uniref:DUF7730 domain-containing protein n=1 Tax=Paraconiothyrium brasiliense TaxID=300254 RepID=A0ABR3R5G2_9PLEO